MANTLRFKRGLASGIPTAVAGEPLFTTDTFDLYIGNGTTNTRFQKYIASGTTSQLLRGDGSLLTMPIVLTSPANGQVLKFNGTNWVNDSDAGITGSGAAGQVAYFTGATTQGGSNNLFWDTTNVRLGIRTASPVATLEVSYNLGGSGLSTLLSNPMFAITNPANYGYPVGIVFRAPMTNGGSVTNIGSIWCEWQSDNNTFLGFATNTSGTVSEKMRLTALGNLHIGTFSSDSGQRLQVIGDTLLKGSGNTSATTALLVENSDGTDILQVRNDGAVFIGAVGITQRPYLAGYTNLTEFGGAQRSLGIVTQFIAGNRPDPAILIKNSANLDYTSGVGNFLFLTLNYSPTSGTGILNNYVINPTINQTGGANGITRGLLVSPTLTAAADWRSIEWSNNTGWGLYGVGTANNHINGSLGIATTSLTGFSLRVSRNITGAVESIGIQQSGAVSNDVTTVAVGFDNALVLNSGAVTNAYNHFRARRQVYAATSFGTQIGFLANNTLTDATNNYGFFGDIAAATGRWNIYMNGTANNYMAGSLGIGSTTLTGRSLSIERQITGSVTSHGVIQNGTVQLDVTSTAYGFRNIINTVNSLTVGVYNHFYAQQGTIGTSNTITEQSGFYVANLTSGTFNFGFRGQVASGTNRWNLYMDGTALNYLNGNTLIGSTTDSGEKLQVNGTMKVTGATTIGSTTSISGTAYTLLALNNTNAVDWGTHISFAGNGTVFGYFGSVGSLLGNTTKDLTVYATAGNGFRVYTNGNNLRATIDASGNLGLGVTPSAWSAAWKALQIQTASFAALSSQYTFVGQNFYNDGTSKFIGNGRAALYQQYDGVHSWYYTANNTSGAGASATFTQAMTLDASGNLAVGTTTANRRFTVGGTANAYMSLNATSNRNTTIGSDSNGNFIVYDDTAAAYRFVVSPIGNVLVGNTSDTGEKFQVTGTAKITGATTLNSTLTLSSTASSFIVLDNTTATTGRQWRASAAANGRFFLTNVTDAIDVLTIQTSGAASFSNSVTIATNLVLNGTSIEQNNASGLTLNASNASGAILFRTAGSERMSISNTGAANFSSSIQAATAIAIGTTPDTNNPFKILKNINATVGIKFENTNTSSGAFSAVQLGTDITGGTKFTNLVYSSSGVTQTGVYHPDGTSLINNGAGGVNFLGTPFRIYTGSGNGALRILFDNEGTTQFTATTPTTNATDGYKQYSADVTAGNAAPHFRTENGAVIKLYQETTAVGNSTISVGGGSAVLDDTEFDGYTLRQIVKALRNQGILA